MRRRAYSLIPPRFMPDLQRVQVGQHVLDLLLVEGVAKAVHFGAAEANDFAHPRIVGGNATDWKVLPFENAFEPRAFSSAGGVGIVAAVAMLVIKVASDSLLRVQAEFGVAFSTLDFAAGEKRQDKEGAQRRGAEGMCGIVIFERHANVSTITKNAV